MVLPLLGLFACREAAVLPGGSPGGTLVIATTGDADVLFPPLVATTTGRQATELIYDYLADVGQDLNTTGDKGYTPRLARSWEWSADSLSIAFHIDAKARWHDGVPALADDVAFTHEVYTDPRVGSSTATQLSNIASVTAVDSLTVLFRFHRRNSLQFFDATSQMLILPRHIFGNVPRDSLRHVVSAITPTGTGPYRFVSWKHAASLELGADTTNYRGSAAIRRLIWAITPSAVTAAAQLFAGQADLYETMTADDVKKAANYPGVRIMSSPGTDYVFMRFNLRDPKTQARPHPLFVSRELRRALSMAVDRSAMVRNVFDTLAQTGIGPTIRAYPTTDTSLAQLPHDPTRATHLLDSLGWQRSGETTVRERKGRKLSFSLLVPGSSMNRKRMAVLLQEQLRRVGVGVAIDEVEFSTFQQRLHARDFDAVLDSWHLGASAAIVKETWSSAAARNKGPNRGSYVSATFDALVDSAMSAAEPSTARRYYTRAYQVAIDDAPAIWLYEPRMVLGISSRIDIGPIRPDAWWMSLPEWGIPAASRIDRDRVAR